MSNNEQNKGLATILAFFTGFTAGAIIGLLYAPSSGEEMRKKVRDTSTDMKNQTVGYAQRTVGTIKEGIQTIRTRQDDATDNGDEATEET